MTRRLRKALTNWANTHRCPLCGVRRRKGPRLNAHIWVDHGDIGE